MLLLLSCSEYDYETMIAIMADMVHVKQTCPSGIITDHERLRLNVKTLGDRNLSFFRNFRKSCDINPATRLSQISLKPFSRFIHTSRLLAKMLAQMVTAEIFSVFPNADRKL